MAGTTLADMRDLARSANLELQMVHLAPVGEIPVPSIVHLRSQHYSAVVGQKDGQYVLRDPGLGGPGGMPRYSFHPNKISLLIDDVPLGYTPPVGPPINFHLSYDHKEGRHPQTFGFGHVGPMWSNATITNWMLAWDLPGGHGWARNIPHSIKRPLESRVWHRYPDQSSNSHHTHGTGTQPSLVGRVLDGGVSQVTTMTYNAKGMVTSKIDPDGSADTVTNRLATVTYGVQWLTL